MPILTCSWNIARIALECTLEYYIMKYLTRASRSNAGTIPEEDDSIFVILELMDKGDLRSLIWEPKIVPSWKTRLRLLLDASEGMSYLHCVKKQIHRDLKTPNILLAESKNECGLVAKIGT